MTTTIKQRVTVQSDGSVTVRSPEFRRGDQAEVTVRLERPGVTELVDRIQGLLLLKPNWDGYGADAIRNDIVDAASRFVERWQAHLAGTQPLLAPVPTGGVLLSWQLAERDLELEFIDPHRVEYSNLDARSGQAVTGVFGVDDDPDSPEPARFLSLLQHFVAR